MAAARLRRVARAAGRSPRSSRSTTSRASRPTSARSTTSRAAFTTARLPRGRAAQRAAWPLAVTAVCLVIALPTAFYVAKVAKPWARRGLIVSCFCRCGPATSSRATRGRRCCARPASGTTTAGSSDRCSASRPASARSPSIIALTYLWLPFMILPIYAGLERLPSSLLDAAGDLGAKPLRTFTSVIVPMLVPSIAAGSIFTFSLSLGDYITPRIVTEGKVTMIGNLIYSTLLAPNQPLAAAYTLWPLLIIVVYLLGMKRARRLREPVRAGDALLVPHPADAADVDGAHAGRSCTSRSPSWRSCRSTRRTSLSWPPQGFTLDWWRQTWETDGPRDALWNSVKVALAATAIALVLGTLAAVRACSATASSAATRCRSCSCCRSPCPASSPASPCRTRSTARIDLGLLELPGRLRVPLARHRPRHVLRRPRLQQRDRPAAPHRHRTCSRRRPTSAPTAARRSAT